MKKKKIIIALIVIVIVVCIVSAVGAFLVIRNINFSNVDSKVTTTVDGKTSTKERLNPVTVNNRVVNGTNDFNTNLSELSFKNKENSTLAEVTTMRDELLALLGDNRTILQESKDTLEDYDSYKELIEGTIAYYYGYETIVGSLYSDEILAIIFKENISQEEYDKAIAQQTNFNQKKKEIDQAFDAIYAKYRDEKGIK